jgi:hypothetical protein
VKSTFYEVLKKLSVFIKETYEMQSNYNLLKKIVEKDGLKAFKFHKKIADNTSQGSVGILQCVLDTETTEENNEMSSRDYMIEKSLLKTSIRKDKDNLIIYKIGTETPFLCRHEHAVSVSLHELSNFLPNFMRPYDLIKNARADPRQKNPFVSNTYDTKNFNGDEKKRSAVRSRPKTFSDLALFEYINSSTTLAQLITNNVKGRRPTRVTLTEDLLKINASKIHIINSLLNQLMIATLIAQQKLLFIHNDLHFDNVLVCNCLERTFALYVFEINGSGANNDNSDCVVCYALIPTFGYYPVIIDYGFSFSKNLLGGPLLTGIHHNNKGYMNHQYDELTDFKTMLVRLAYSNYKFGTEDSDFQELMKKELLKKLPIDRQTGWDETKDVSISKQLVRYIRPFIDSYLKDSFRESFFQKYDYEMVDMIGSLIILPLTNKNSDNLVESLHTFLEEWLKIEKWILSSHMKIFVFKNIIDKIRTDLLDPMQSFDFRSFQKTLHKIMDEVGNNISLSALNYERFYKSIISLSNCFEAIMYKANQKCINRKNKEYSKLNVRSSLDMYQLVEPFISVEYTINYGDYFVVFNAINETTSSFVLKDRQVIKNVNDMERTERAEYLYKSMI